MRYRWNLKLIFIFWILKIVLCVGILQAQEQDFMKNLEQKEREKAIINLQKMDFMRFYKQVHKQSVDGDFIRFRHRILLSYEFYKSLKEEERAAFNVYYPLVLVFSKISKFIYFNEISGVGIKSEVGANLQFDIRFYENLRGIDLGGDIFAMCVLPYFDKCILLGENPSKLR
ncbi:MAG: hypothetical protein SOW25_07925 [Helicobacter sp.]|nr:hypothetical protein [Helicobacteraceae bacterium]MDY3114232.1 hypothetical protein [Helicobacter sp.]